MSYFSDLLNSKSKGLNFPLGNFMVPQTRNLPNGGGSYTVGQQTPGTFIGPQNKITPAPVVQPPVVVNQQSPQVTNTPAVSQNQPNNKYINPVTGQYYTPQEYADVVAQKIPVSKNNGDVGTYAGNAITNPNQTKEQLNRSAYGMNNARNDIAVGQTDPYDITQGGKIVYSPQERAAIEKAYAGIYDPALSDVFTKLDTQAKKEVADLAQKNKLEEMAQQHKYDLELKKTPAGGTSGLNDTGTYTSDLDAIVGNTYNLISSKNGKDAFASSIKNARNDSDKLNSVATIVLANSPSAVKTDFVNQANGVASIDKAIETLKSGVSTGLINSATQYLYNIAGKDYDPKLAAIQAYITTAIQPYRSSITGAAWGTKEDKEYEALFGSTKYTPAELLARLQRIKEIMLSKSTTALSSQVSPLSSQNIFSSPTVSPSVDNTNSNMDAEYENYLNSLK